jgi:hypothetical protein
MFREPLAPSDEVPDQDLDGPDLEVGSARAALVFATIFILIAFYQFYLMIRRKAWCTWTLVAASTLQNISMVAHAYDLTYDDSIPWSIAEGLIYP